MRLTENNGVTLYHFELPAFESVTSFVTTRHNASRNANARGNFNLGLYCGDDATQVEANLQQLCASLSITRSQLFYPHQVHGSEILSIDSTFLSLPHEEQLSLLDGVDAIVTNVPGIAIAVTTADCVPIILYDPEHQAIAAIHAGWRGTAKQIVRHTIEQMKQQYGTLPTQLCAGLGPAISIDAYEVGKEVVDSMRMAGLNIDSISIRNPRAGKMHLDISAANVEQLLQCGVDLMNIEVCGICTHRNSDDFYSVRALGSETGRFLTGVMLPAK